MQKPSFPTPHEIARWITDTIRHCCHIEHYLDRLQVGVADLQRPHDIIGHGSKLDWPAIRGFSMQYREAESLGGRAEVYMTYILPSLNFHRQQYHHLAWNEFNPNASVDSMKLGAVDACCSLLEPRDYQGGCHDWDRLSEVTMRNPIHKVPWMLLMAEEMKKIEQPPISGITAFDIPKDGFRPETRDVITERASETVKMLKQDHGIKVVL